MSEDITSLVRQLLSFFSEDEDATFIFIQTEEGPIQVPEDMAEVVRDLREETR